MCVVACLRASRLLSRVCPEQNDDDAPEPVLERRARTTIYRLEDDLSGGALAWSAFAGSGLQQGKAKFIDRNSTCASRTRSMCGAHA